MRYLSIIIPLIVLVSACNNDKKVSSESVSSVDTIRPDEIVTIEEVKPFVDFRTFWEYYARKIKLNEDFIGYDKDKNRISKVKFMNLLERGTFQPIVINPTDTIRYQLLPSPAGADKSIAVYMNSFAKEQLTFYGMEGQPLPKFSFRTIHGVPYNSENTLGKILVIKCWFISCVPCVKEMPELNHLVTKYKDRKDIVFLSLAIDDKKPLETFLENTRFEYQTVANQEDYMSNRLHVTGYPTHILVDKNGKLVKVANEAGQLETFLERLLEKL
jgi:thiol-disulfide isomerase/thioredoxin